ncbi:MAG: hypothetical protein QOD76_683, partial [Solirubrobacteraceae bacterium]|nr:hypothetical protein [Solirubrobacteraceae bacterium]
MLRRFVEASRRAEIIALVNSVRTESELGEVVTSELCEAYEAEIAFLMTARADGGLPEVVGSVGLPRGAGGGPLQDGCCINALGATEPQLYAGTDLLGHGARRLVLASFRSDAGDRAVVGVARLYDQAFDEAEVALLEAVTNSTGHALERSWLGQERDRHAAQQAALARAAKLLHASLELEEVLDTLCREVAVALSGDVVVVCFGEEADGLVAVADHGADGRFIGWRCEPGEGLSGAALVSGRPQVSSAYREEGRHPVATPAGEPIRAGMSVPLQRRDEVDGVLTVYYVRERVISDGDVELLNAFADLAGVACRNADEHAAARRAATMDSLTGCLNHAAFQTRLREEISRAERGTEPFALALLDLDGFKLVNERFGHLTGDTVLRTVGELLRGAVRLHDQVARFGGDEFALLLPATDEETAELVVGRALSALGAAPLPASGALTARAGCAQWLRGDQANALIERADRSLRASKREFHARPGLDAWLADEDGLQAGHNGSREQAERRMRRLAIAGEMGARLSRLLEPGAIAKMSVLELHDALGYEQCALVSLDRGALSLMARSDEDAYSHGLELQGPDEAAIQRCMRERRPVLVNDARRDPLYADVLPDHVRSELAVPLYIGSELWGAIDVRDSAVNAFDAEDAQLVQTVADHVGAALRTADLYRELEQTYVGTAEALAAALEAKDDYTAGHARSIADAAVEVGRALGLDESALRNVRYGAIFHDIGKIAVPDAILHKPGKLTSAEFEVVKRHPIHGEEILAPVPFLADVRRIVRHDHERWDGAGYPDGLRGPQIPIGARIVFVVDAFHAMVSDRPYRHGMAETEARA